MRKKRDRKPIPMFYINQPDINMPEPKMQKSYLLKDDDSEIQNPGMADMENPTREKQNDITQEITLSVDSHSDDTETEPEPLQENNKRQFNELTLDEKIKHLMRVPASIAKVKYEFITKETSYKGFFLAMKNGVLMIHSLSPRKKSVSILEEDLMDIKRVGL
ncbi:CotO family spore coat protein [Heyndrickxia sp. MSNUG]|uniref:CotO family spore coat protein n=1 Tax=Heyndrickxia sp. MSNUG TaxID=3136677 RepID=UPI003C2EB948